MILFFLLIAGTGTTLRAQLDVPDPAESLFNNPKPAKGNASFIFYFSAHTRMIIDLWYISQLSNLPNLDSFVNAASAYLTPLQDSLRSDGMVRRVDLAMFNNVPKIRIISHPELSNTYTVKDNELLQLKVNQDTVHIMGYANSNVVTQYTMNGVSAKRPLGAPFSITFIVDNVSDIAKLSPGEINNCITLLRESMKREVRADKWNAMVISYRAVFNKQTGTMAMVRPFNFSFIGEPKMNIFAGTSLSYVRGAFSPGFVVGLDYNLKRGTTNRSKLRAFIETQAFFSRDPVTNKINTEIDRFVGIQYIQIPRQTDKLSLAGNLSLAYLVSKSSWYEPHSFRLGLPMLHSRNIKIEPQIVFNGFFKNVSPSIRLLIDF